MYPSLKDKVAIVTGSGREGGLGQGILRRLGEEGCKLVVTDLGTPQSHMGEGDIGTTEEVERVADGLRQATGAEVITIACDVRSAVDCHRLIASTKANFGRVDILVNNAGIGYMMKSLFDMAPDEWNAVIDVNLTGAFYCTQAAAKAMVDQGAGGRIINIASQAGKSGFPHMAPYTASKHGMIGLTRSNALELGAHGITVNAVCPNHVTTQLGEKQNAYFSKLLGFDSVEAYLDAMAKKNPMGRPGKVTDTAAACAFLASDEAFYMTGEAINVSGGEEMH